MKLHLNKINFEILSSFKTFTLLFNKNKFYKGKNSERVEAKWDSKSGHGW